MKLPNLPTFYYHDNFVEMISHVSETYASVMSDAHRAFVTSFRQLSKHAQCLLIRMINRQGRFFHRKTLRYVEISDIDNRLLELGQSGFVSNLQSSDYAAFLACMPKSALARGGVAAGVNGMRSSWPKAKLVQHLIDHVSFDRAREIYQADQYVVLADPDAIEFLLYLYFGKTETSLKSFALRDLGIVRTNKVTNLSARFSDAAEANACFTYSRLARQLDTKCDAILHGAIAFILDGPACETDYARDLRAQTAFKAGSLVEKSGDKPLAIQLYRLGSCEKCNERLVRLIYADGKREEAAQLLQRMIDDPLNDNEHTFASDFYARKFGKQRTSSYTALLRSAPTIVVDDAWRSNPEAGIAAVMRRQGHNVYYAENTVWCSLFGLLFWDELFESGQLNSNFDWLPQCLISRTFAHVFAAQIVEKLALVNSQAALPLILRTAAARWGRPNGIFAWRSVKLDALRALLTAHPRGVAAILRLICDNFSTMRDGFPDLMTEKDGVIGFLEVKAEGDVIRRNQMTRLRQLRSAGISGEIVRVDFRFDPEQDYVVVDIETTGSWSNGNRITEIGAVKVRNHEVVDEWHSLINPQRLIPGNITRLTGITNEMVRGAPLFAEIANSFMSFMGDGVFVAHSVNFDYGFIASEYERLGRRFRFPKLCTCASMRRKFRGLKSYGLKALCEQFNISLETHHRALHDARATVGLLRLINKQRVSAELYAGPSATSQEAEMQAAC